MRFISRGALLALGAVLAMSALATASASASECPGTGGGVALCIGGHAQSGSFAFTSKHASGTAIELSFKTLGIHVNCSASKGSGELVASGGVVEIKKDSIEWSGCNVAGNASCTVSPMHFGISGGLKGSFALAGELAEMTLSGAEKELFGELHISGCEEEREGTIKGKQKCFMLKSTVERTAQKFECPESGSNLQNTGATLTIRNTEEISLTSGQSYSLQRS